MASGQQVPVYLDSGTEIVQIGIAKVVSVNPAEMEITYTFSMDTSDETAEIISNRVPGAHLRIRYPRELYPFPG